MQKSEAAIAVSGFWASGRVRAEALFQHTAPLLIQWYHYQSDCFGLRRDCTALCTATPRSRSGVARYQAHISKRHAIFLFKRFHTWSMTTPHSVCGTTHSTKPWIKYQRRDYRKFIGRAFDSIFRTLSAFRVSCILCAVSSVKPTRVGKCVYENYRFPGKVFKHNEKSTKHVESITAPG